MKKYLFAALLLAAGSSFAWECPDDPNSYSCGLVDPDMDEAEEWYLYQRLQKEDPLQFSPEEPQPEDFLLNGPLTDQESGGL